MFSAYFAGQHGDFDIISELSDSFPFLVINFSRAFLQGYVALFINLKQTNNSDSKVHNQQSLAV